MARQAEQDPTNLYIANLPHTIKENDLENMFSQYGRVSYLNKNQIIKMRQTSLKVFNHIGKFNPFESYYKLV